MSIYAPECESLAAVAAGARAQIAALRDGRPKTFEAATAQTLDAVALLDRRRRARSRHADTADRAVLDAAVREARQACDELTFALEHAVALGRDLISAWQEIAAPPTAGVYTAHGATGTPTAGRLHHTG